MEERGKTRSLYWLFTIGMMLLVLFLAGILASPFLLKDVYIDASSISAFAVQGVESLTDDSADENVVWFKMMIWVGAIGIFVFFFYLLVELMLGKLEVRKMRRIMQGI